MLIVITSYHIPGENNVRFLPEIWKYTLQKYDDDNEKR